MSFDADSDPNARAPQRDPTVSEYLYQRRLKAGWPAERAASQPSQKRTPTIRVDGVATTVAEARARSGVSYWTYYSRIRIGWSKTRAASTPPGTGARPDAKIPSEFEYRGRRMSLRRWSQELGVNYRTVLDRIKRGLSFSEAVQHPLKAPLPQKRVRYRRPK